MSDKYLEKLVNFYPVSSNQKSVWALLEFCKNQAEKLGLTAEFMTRGGIENLYISRTGEKHVKLLLQAHVDVVPAENQPFKMTEDTLEGRGTYDMLFAVACYLRLIDDLASKLPNLDMAIMLSGDEELSGEHGVKAFLEAGYACDACILPDAGDGYGTLSVGAKGIWEPTIRIQGAAHHGARPWEGEGAASKLVHFLSDAEKLFTSADRNDSTMTVSVLNAGSAMNVGPAYADVTLDIRYRDAEDFQRIQTGMQALLEQYDGKVLEALEGDYYRLDMTNPLVTQFVELYNQQLGKNIRQMVAPGSSDARFFTKYNIPVIMLRPDGGGAHGDNEWISRESLERFYKLLRDYVSEVAKVK